MQKTEQHDPIDALREIHKCVSSFNYKNEMQNERTKEKERKEEERTKEN